MLLKEVLINVEQIAVVSSPTHSFLTSGALSSVQGLSTIHNAFYDHWVNEDDFSRLHIYVEPETQGTYQVTSKHKK